MRHALASLAESLEEPVHLVLGDEYSGVVELIALKIDGQYTDAFPLSSDLHGSVVEVAEKFSLAVTWLDFTTASRLALEQLPEDFWDELSEEKIGEQLTVTFLGRSAKKYLGLYRAVRMGDAKQAEGLKELSLTPRELARMTKWLRDEKLFDHHSGELIMEILRVLH